MPKFSQLSASRLATCDQRLQNLMNEVIKRIDISILCGHRGEDEQNEAWRTGRSTKKWPGSKHNHMPSKAVDVAPYFPDVKIDWDDLPAFARVAGYIQRVADEQGVKIRWGGDWDQDGRTADEKFIDMPHFEMMD